MYAVYMGSTMLKQGFASQLAELDGVDRHVYDTNVCSHLHLPCIKGGLCDRTTVRVNLSLLWLKQTNQSNQVTLVLVQLSMFWAVLRTYVDIT
jgi:hypothetical protein